jgi:hypothetical protein
MSKGPLPKSGNQKLVDWSLGTLATLALVAAGISGLSKPAITVLAVCLGLALYAVFWAVLESNASPHKVYISTGTVAVLLLGALILEFTWVPRLEKVPPPPAQASKVPPPTVTGSVTASGENSTAIVGYGNTVTRGDSETAGKKGKKQ